MDNIIFKKRICIFIIFLCLLNIQNTLALENGLARTPPMGWNSWNHFGGNINETIVREIADAMVSSGMRDAGYVYVNIDDTWQISREGSTIVADFSKFPSGMKALADYAHSLGLKLGLYSDRGTATCAGHPGSFGYETEDANTYASWGIDYLKYDNCNAGPEIQEDYERMRDALLNCGRPICYSICAWQFYTWAPGCGNLWRTTGDIQPSWDSICSIIDINESLAQYAGPGHWNDPDMLEVGNGSLSYSEYRAHFSLWCIMAAPLLAGNDLRNMSQGIIDILTNEEAISVNQDPAGIQGTRVVDDGDLEVWCKPLGSANGNTKAVVLFNRSGAVANMTVRWSDINMPGSAEVRDLWAKTGLGTYSDSFSTSVPSHDVVMLTITLSDPNATPGPTNAPTMDPGDCTCLTGCGTRTTITADFMYDGVGEYCWESTCLGEYINSWNVTILEVNGVDCANGYVEVSSITPINGKYYVYYRGDYSYSHLEIIGDCSGTETPAPTPAPEVTPQPTDVATPAPTDVPAQTPTSPPQTSLGDVNDDSSIDIVDALLIAQYYVGLNPSGFNSSNADTDCNGSIDILDALLVAQYYVGLVTEFC